MKKQFVYTQDADTKDALLKEGLTLLKVNNLNHNTPFWVFMDNSERFCYTFSPEVRQKCFVSDTLRMFF